MKLTRWYAVPIGMAAVSVVWWAAASRKPAPVERSIPFPRRAPTAAPDRPDPAPATAPQELPPPEPVLRQSAQRRFSNPVSNGTAAKGVPGAENSARTSGAARLSPGDVNLPGGYVAPTASFAPRAAARGVAATAASDGFDAPMAKNILSEDRAVSTSKGSGRKNRRVPKADAPPDDKQSGAAANLVSAARKLKARGDAATMRANSSVGAGIMRQLALDSKVDAGIRGAIERLSRSGEPAAPEAVEKAAEDVMRENGLEPEEEDVKIAVARASNPLLPDVSPEAYVEPVKDVVSAPALPPATKAEVQTLADQPPPEREAPPRGPPPRGALDAYSKYKDVFDKARERFGVEPEHILAILKIETDLGRNTGTYPLPPTLKAINEKAKPDGTPTKAALQAGRDQIALGRLSAQGNLGGLKPDQINGSYAGAMGIAQCLPSSCEAYYRTPDDGRFDPFNFSHAIFFVGNYLKVHGYSKDVARSILAYNHSQEYVDKVQGLSADIKPALDAAASRIKK